MGICTDKSTTYLKQHGYNVVRLPREGIRPLDLIGRQRDAVNYLGRLDKLLTHPSHALPPIKSNAESAEIHGQTSSKLPLAIGLNVLDSILSALGAGAGITANYKGAKTLQFGFGKPLVDTVAQLDIGQYLKNGEIDDDNLILKEYVLGNGDLFIITETIKTNKFTVSAEASGGGEFKLDVPAIQQLLSAGVQVSVDANSAGTVSYEGPKLLVFGFKCVQMGWTDEGMRLVNVKPGSVAMAAGDEGAPEMRPSILDPNGLLDMEF